MKEACKLKITLLIFLFSGMAVSAQVINRVKILQTFYDDFKSILDKGDTVKLVEFNNCLRNAKDYGCEPEFALIQAIKKNDNTILYKECITPNLRENGVTIDDRFSLKITVDKNAEMPDYKTFECVPYSVEIPLDVYVDHNNFKCMLNDCRGRIRIISDRMKYDTGSDKKNESCLILAIPTII